MVTAPVAIRIAFGSMFILSERSSWRSANERAYAQSALGVGRRCNGGRAPSQAGAASGQPHGLTARTFRSPRQTTRYWEAGPANGPLMIFLHGWPEIGLIWRAQIEAFVSEGWHCVAPDMRGYGGSSAPTNSKAYALKEIVNDMVELHDYLGGRPAIWVGHDWGSPVAGALAAHHGARSRGVVLMSVPYFPTGFALPTLLPLVDRQLYPADQYPDGQWDYFRFYEFTSSRRSPTSTRTSRRRSRLFIGRGTPRPRARSPRPPRSRLTEDVTAQLTAHRQLRRTPRFGRPPISTPWLRRSVSTGSAHPTLGT